MAPHTGDDIGTKRGITFNLHSLKLGVHAAEPRFCLRSVRVVTPSGQIPSYLVRDASGTPVQNPRNFPNAVSLFSEQSDLQSFCFCYLSFFLHTPRIVPQCSDSKRNLRRLDEQVVAGAIRDKRVDPSLFKDCVH